MGIDKIQILSSIEAIRKRPGMYAGDLTASTLPNELAKQVLCHALDEAASGRCTRLWAHLRPDYIMVKYDAPMSFEMLGDKTKAEVMLTEIGACHNLKENMAVGDDYCTLGLAVLTAFCASMTVLTGGGQDHRAFLFYRGSPEYVMCPYPIDGTSIGINLDPDILGENVVFDTDEMRAHLGAIAESFPDLKIEVC